MDKKWKHLLIGAAILYQMTSQHQCMFLNGTITKAKAFFGSNAYQTFVPRKLECRHVDVGKFRIKTKCVSILTY